MPETDNTFWTVEVNWADGSTTTIVLDSENLGGLDWATWISNFTVKAASRPTWFTLGDLVFHSQNVRSIRLMETFEKEG